MKYAATKLLFVLLTFVVRMCSTRRGLGGSCEVCLALTDWMLFLIRFSLIWLLSLLPHSPLATSLNSSNISRY